MKFKADLIGEVFGRLIVLARDGTIGTSSTWVCRCECGTEKVIRRNHLVTSHTTSCGCAKRELNAAQITAIRTTHGASKTRAYKAWVNMKQRCMNPKNSRYASYGGRGITIDSSWMNFDQFLADMGNPPSDRHTIERQENNGNYCPSNCSWIPMPDQASNKRTNVKLTLNERTQTVNQWARELRIPHQTIRARLLRGLSHKEALEA
jgi:hypothetical protein